MSELTMVPAGDLLGDLELLALPNAAIPLEAIVLIKALDEEGRAAWFTRMTADLSDMESVGVLDVAHQLAKEGVLDCYMDENPDDDDDGLI